MFLRETANRYLILEMCEFRLWLYSGSSHHVFQRIGIKLHTDDKLSNVDSTLSGQLNWKQ